MTREKAVEMIENDIRLHHDSLSGEYRKALNMAIDALNDNKWIPCSERLPEDDSPVLISHKFGVTRAWWNGMIWTNSLTKKFKTVKAWMELPNPYKGEI